MRRLLMFVLVAVLISGSTLPILADTPAKRDAAAVAYVQTSIAALGGDAGWQQVKDSVVQANLLPTKDSWVKPATLVWKTYGPEFRYETSRDSGTQVFVSGFGKPAVSQGDKILPLAYHVAECAPAYHLPAALLSRELADQTFSIIDAGDGTLSGEPVHTVHISSSASDLEAAATLQTWYLDQITGLPLRVEYRLPDASDMASFTDAAFDFADYRKVNDLLIPFSLTHDESGSPLEVIAVTAADFNTGLDPSEFDLLGGGQ